MATSTIRRTSRSRPRADANTVPRRREAIALAIAGVLAVAVVGSGLDRLSDAGNVDQAIVPWPFRAAADRAATIAYLDQRRPAKATAAARLAIAHEPRDARSIAAYATSLLEQGDEEGAAKAYAVSRALGWREPWTNVYWFGERLRNGDPAGAATYADALLRQSPALSRRNRMFDPIEATPEGRAAIARRLAAAPAWQASYFLDTTAPGEGDPIARADVARRLARDEHVRDCGLVAPLLSALVRVRQPASALEVYRLHCAADAASSIIADGLFLRANIAAPSTPLDWQFSAEGAIDVRLERRQGIRGRAVIVSNEGPIEFAFIGQLSLAAPGEHRVSWRATQASGAPSEAIDVAIACGKQVHPWSVKQRLDPRTSRFEATIVVPPDCAEPWLSFGVAQGARDIALAEVALR
jgi:hypothetical protein